MQKLRTLLFSTLFLLPVSWAVAVSDSLKAGCPEVKLQVEQLPDLNIPRAGHEVFCANGELTVAGGHTDGFVPTPTAEYFKDGKWHTLQMTYPHDNAFSVVLRSGKVMLGGGSEQPIGIGQTFVTETYDPQTHSFSGYCSLQRKRASASALELDSGRVVVAGNWYHDDGIELFEDKAGTLADYNGKRLFIYLKDVSVERAYPFIFRTAKDDALIFGGVGVKGDSLWSSTAYTLKGDSVTIPLFEDWWPLCSDTNRSDESFYGDADNGLYAYLLGVVNRDGQVAIAKVVNGEFSLLPTACLVPMHSQGEEICYSSAILVDQKARRGYLVGFSKDYSKAPEKAWRWYVLSVDYTVQPAALTLYYTEPVADFNICSPILTPEGNLMIAGGLYHGSNFTPSKRVLLLRVGQESAVAQAATPRWLMALLIGAAVLVVFGCVFMMMKRRRQRLADGSESSEPAISAGASALLMQRIDQLMETQKLYQNSDLKVTDLATALGTNRRAVSDCINSQKGCTFTQFVNLYRVDHAKRILRQNPDKKIVDIYIESGFANEGSFFRTFKAVTGMTPKEWLTKS